MLVTKRHVNYIIILIKFKIFEIVTKKSKLILKYKIIS